MGVDTKQPLKAPEEERWIKLLKLKDKFSPGTLFVSQRRIDQDRKRWAPAMLIQQSPFINTPVMGKDWTGTSHGTRAARRLAVYHIPRK